MLSRPKRVNGNPRVSIVMNCFNGAAFLREAIESVYAQTYQDWEIIFWDNASTDASTSIARSFGERVQCFRSVSTVNLGEARNSALREARGEFIAFLDCDDLWLPEKLDRQILLFDQNPALGLVACDAINFSAAGELNRVYQDILPPRGNAFRYLLGNYCLVMSSVVVRRSALDFLGEAFDPRFELLEDTELFLRLAKCFPIDVVNAPLAKWRVHGGSETHKKFDRTIVENELMLDKFAFRYPGFAVEYANEVAQVRRKVEFRRAIQAWREGDSGKARKVLRVRPFDPKFLMMYCLTFLPPSMFNYVVRAHFYLKRFRGIR